MMNTPKLGLLTRFVTLAVFLAGTPTSYADDTKVFSHKMHVEEGADCTDCHHVEGTQQLPTLNKGACQECHDEGAPSWRLPVRTRRLPIEFPHKLHAGALKCTDCHEKTGAETQPAGQTLLKRADCAACHQEKAVKVSENNCAACHQGDRRRVAPKDHKNSWLTRHGAESRWRVFDQHGRDCALCHRSDACLTCHKTNRPKSHTALWRMRTHGIQAGWDRDSCKTCHNAGTCIRCHRTVAPQNHKGAWRATHGLAAQVKTNEHCTTCHSLSWCSACHAGVAR